MGQSSDQVEDAALYGELFEELVEDESLQPFARALIDAALRSDSAVAELLADESAELPPLSRSELGEETQTPPVFLKQITVQGFRGAGPSATLDIPPGPGLTVVVGRNGTGKSTFAEALETVLTGTTDRWEERQEWKDAWKNVGWVGVPHVSATLVAEGVGTCVASRTWRKDAELEDGVFKVQPPTAAQGRLDWKRSCETSRPFLSYRRLGAVVDDPASVFDTLQEVLGLELLSAAGARVDVQLKVIAEREKEAKRVLDASLTALAASKDARATELLALLDAKQPEPAVVRVRLLEVRRAVSDGHPVLKRLAAAQLPTQDSWLAVRQELEAAIEDYGLASTQTAEQSHKLIKLLDGALKVLATTPDHCPVCAKPLTDPELDEVVQRRNALQASSTQYGAAKARLERAQKAVADLVGALPNLEGLPATGLEVPVGLLDGMAEVRGALTQAPSGLHGKLTQHAAVLDLMIELRERAKERVLDTDEQFRKLVQPLERWLDVAELGANDQPKKKALSKAKAWLKEATDRHREKRFAPLREATLENWTVMSSGSSVLLNTVRLAGHKNRRKIELGVEVDGHEASGVGVLSQGEINCMALSLFLPKSIHADGPFRFVVIDDPVQAMDQVKVDGLARVLHSAAQKLQVVVLTHDARLMNSLQRLQLACTVLEVRRTAGATLTVQACHPPHERFIRDATRLVKGGDELGEELPRRLVPYFCRTAVESACTQRVFRDRLDAGGTFGDIEEELAGARKLLNRVACALFGDSQRAGEVARYLNENHGKGEAKALFLMKETHHAGSSLSASDLLTLTSRTRDLCKRILQE